MVEKDTLAYTRNGIWAQIKDIFPISILDLSCAVVDSEGLQRR